MRRWVVCLCAAAVLLVTGGGLGWGSAVASTTTTLHVWQQSPACSDAFGANATSPSRPTCTIGAAVSAASSPSVDSAGYAVVVHGGTYREAVYLSKSIASLSASPDEPAGAVVVSGSDVVSGWSPCTASARAVAGECTGVNSRGVGSALWVDLTWKPAALYQGDTKLTLAREPEEDKWEVQTGTNISFTDSVHLIPNGIDGITQTDTLWVNASVTIDYLTGGVAFTKTIVSFTIATSTVTIDSPLYSNWVIQPGDTYFLSNHVGLLTSPGEWVVVQLNSATYRVFLIPLYDVTSYPVEGARRSRFVIEYGSISNTEISGFEVVHGAGHGIGGWSGTPTGLVISNNHVHHCEGNGIELRSTQYSKLVGNTVHDNTDGLTGGMYSIYSRNTIYNNWIDGLLPGDGAYCEENTIRNHANVNHPDNVQFCCTWKKNITFVRNTILYGGQCFMLEMVTDSSWINNTIVGSCAQCLIFGHGTCSNNTVIGNTFGLTGYSAINTYGTRGYTVRNNAFYPAGTSAALTVLSYGMDSDFNLFWNPPTCERGALYYEATGFTNYGVGCQYCHPFEEYQNVSGLDQHSILADPLFTNFPYCMTQVGDVMACTVNKFVLDDNEDCFAVGDNVEVGIDGVMRTVTQLEYEMEGDNRTIVVVTPALSSRLFHSFLLLNWKSQTNPVIDVTPTLESPLCGSGEGGRDIGAISCPKKEHSASNSPHLNAVLGLSLLCILVACL